MTQLTYLKCTRSHLNKGKDLNFVCLMESCRQSSLCCEECIKDYHEGHSKKQLKTLISLGEYLKTKGPSKAQQSQNTTDRTALLNIVEQNQSKTIQAFKALRQDINQILNQFEAMLEEYFNELTLTINQPHTNEDPIKVLECTLNELKSSTEYSKKVNNIKKLLLMLNKVGKDGHLKPTDNHQDVLERLVSQSNKQIADLIEMKLTDMSKILSQSMEFIVKSTANVQNLWQNPLYNFTKSLCHEKIEVQNNTTVISTGESIYQTALMQPQINMNGHNQLFRFKITKMSSNWIAVGVGSKKIIESNNYTFDPYNINHGSFMISANGGSWAHQTPELNNRVRSFKFEEGNIITCIVQPENKKVYFVKQSDVSELIVKERQTFELYLNSEQKDLHPCVVIHYLDNIVEYIPATNASLIPKYDWTFSNTLKNPQVQVINYKSVIISEHFQDGYRACLLNKPIQNDQNWNTTTTFSFMITNCAEEWIGLGICYKQSAIDSFYKFDYDKQNHGYYMISSNGGVWSSIDQSLNNKLGCWRFKTGDVIECQVELGEGPESSNNRIIFRKGKKKYVLNFKCSPVSKLYPCVMLHYSGDEVSVLPEF